MDSFPEHDANGALMSISQCTMAVSYDNLETTPSSDKEGGMTHLSIDLYCNVNNDQTILQLKFFTELELFGILTMLRHK